MKDKLNKYTKNYTSQFGEDGIIEYLIQTSRTPINKSCFEVGAGDGETFSNTFNLWRNLGWNAILVEADERRYSKLIDKYGALTNLKIVTNKLMVEGINSVDDIVLSHNWDSKLNNIGVMSIDIDSYDYHVFDKISKIFPQIVVIEFNNYIPPYIDYNDPIDEVFLRCSAKSIERLAVEKGYKLVACTVTNAILLKSDCFNSALHPDMPVEWLFDYEGQIANGSVPFSLVESQLVSRYPVFSRKVAWGEAFYFKVRGFLAHALANKEVYKKPSMNVIKRIKDAGLYID